MAYQKTKKMSLNLTEKCSECLKDQASAYYHAKPVCQECYKKLAKTAYRNGQRLNHFSNLT